MWDFYGIFRIFGIFWFSKDFRDYLWTLRVFGILGISYRILGFSVFSGILGISGISGIFGDFSDFFGISGIFGLSQMENHPKGKPFFISKGIRIFWTLFGDSVNCLNFFWIEDFLGIERTFGIFLGYFGLFWFLGSPQDFLCSWDFL